MSGLLGLSALRMRVERYFQFQAFHVERYREEIMRVARALVDEGEIPRSRVQEITGKGSTVSAGIINLPGLASGTGGRDAALTQAWCCEYNIQEQKEL
jgi:hypothetical protein